MSLHPGAKLGPYEVVALLGAGGMGEVYRARDSRLGRNVAIKVLPDISASDRQRILRFQREAQLLAALNHPNIAAIYGLEESDGARGLVMELVEGFTLADRIASGPMPLDEVLSLARQIAEALEYAHERGIIHRDLKPANIKITADGTAKVLDFGLAKALEGDSAEVDLQRSPTISAAATRAGIILGTAGYMSPEQAKGRPVDKRTDIWAFGCVLYEMLAGRTAFAGESISDTLASVIRDDPDWSVFPAACPKDLKELARRCLEKDPKRRLRDIGDARNVIEDVTASSAQRPASSIAAAAPSVTPEKKGLSWRGVAVGALFLAIVCLSAGVWYGLRRAPQLLRWSGELLGGPDVAFGARVSPDGHSIAFQAMIDNCTQVAVMNVDSGNWTVLTHDRSHGYVNEVAWSRDGSKLFYDRYFSQPQGIYSVPAVGGDEHPVLEAASTPEVLPDGSLLIARVDADRRKRIFRYWPVEGKLQALNAWTPPQNDHVPLRVSPDGNKAVIFGWVDPKTFLSPAVFYVMDILTGESRRLAPELRIKGLTLGTTVAFTPDSRSVLVDVPSGDVHEIMSIAVSGSGVAKMLLTLTEDAGWLDIGPDGSIYLDQVDRPQEVLRFPESGGTPEVVASSEFYQSATNSQAIEFADGRFLNPTLRSGRSRLMIGKPGSNFFPLLDSEEETAEPAALLPDDSLAFFAGTGSSRGIVIAKAREGRIVRRLKGVKAQQVGQMAASPDGKTLYYVADGSVWAIPTEDGEPSKICTGDGLAMNPNGKELVVNLDETAGVRLIRVPLSGAPQSDLRTESDLLLTVAPLAANAIRGDGKILVGITARDSWFYGNAILDAAKGQLKRIPLNYTGDVLYSGWAKDGRIIAFGFPLRARLWRFRPVLSNSN